MTSTPDARPAPRPAGGPAGSSGPSLGSRAGERPHAPRVGRFARLLGPLYFNSPFWYRFPLRLARWTPEPVLRLVVPVLSALATALLIGIRRAVASNLEHALGPTGRVGRWRRAFRTIQLSAWCVIERNEQFLPKRPFDVEFEGLERWEEVVSRGAGFILATAHVGNWELGSTIPVTRQGLVIHVVREPEANPAAQAYTTELLDGLGGVDYRTHFATDDTSLGVELLAALREGEVVALQADRPRSNGRTERVAFLGTTLEMPTGPVALARLADVPILPIFTVREGRRRYRLRIRPAVVVGRTRDRDGDHRAALATLAREIEGVVRAAPHQWFCFREVSTSVSEPGASGAPSPPAGPR